LTFIAETALMELAKKHFYLSSLVIVVFAITRLIVGQVNPSYFIVAGSDFVDSTKITHPIKINEGQGYDGQFFYHYSLNPFQFEKEANGITVDLPVYRIQRIGYPFLAWLLSFGGKPFLVSWALILINVLAFIGIVFYTNKLVIHFNSNQKNNILPLFLCGIFMSLARDLAEVLELFFFISMVYYLFKQHYWTAIILATLAIFTRETSIIAIAPILFLKSIEIYKKEKSFKLIMLSALPFMLFALWKYIIQVNMIDNEMGTGYSKVGLPFVGIWDGLMYNFDLSDTKHILQFLFWSAYLIWNIYLVIIIFKIIEFKNTLTLSNTSILSIAYIIWFAFALCLTITIYIDDWGFLRIFSLWNMIGFMLLIMYNKTTPKLFHLFSILMLSLTLFRLIIRV